MTNTTDTTTAQEAQEAPVSPDQTVEAQTLTEPTTEPQEATEGTEEEREPRSTEAKKYRLQLRDAQAELTTVRAQVEALQRAEVDRLAQADGIRPAALWAGGADLASLLTEAGTVDSERVAAAVTTTRELFGLDRTIAPRAEGVQGNTGGPVTVTKEPSFTDAFKPRK